MKPHQQRDILQFFGAFYWFVSIVGQRRLGSYVSPRGHLVLNDCLCARTFVKMGFSPIEPSPRASFLMGLNALLIIRHDYLGNFQFQTINIHCGDVDLISADVDLLAKRVPRLWES